MSILSGEKKHVLVAGSEPRLLAEIKKALIGTFDVSLAASSEAALSALNDYDTSLLMISLGEASECVFAAYGKVAETVAGKGVPVVFIAEKENGIDETEAFRLGAVDYAVRKPGAESALISRANHRILASENEKRLQTCGDEKFDSTADVEAMQFDKTILVVDDIEINREIVAGMLSEIQGLSIEMASDGNEAVDKFNKSPNRFSLILMDVQMPTMSGLEATRAIRSMSYSNAREVPIIALTAGVEEGDVSSFYDAGMNDYIKKPMDFDDLRSLIYKHL